MEMGDGGYSYDYGDGVVVGVDDYYVVVVLFLFDGMKFGVVLEVEVVVKLF